MIYMLVCMRSLREREASLDQVLVSLVSMVRIEGEKR